jgi:hypothetical protein
MNIYKRLPNDLQIMIKYYFRIEERWGIPHFQCPNPNPSKYYTVIREYPTFLKKFWHHKNIFYYRPTHSVYHWQLDITNDVWILSGYNHTYLDIDIDSFHYNYIKPPNGMWISGIEISPYFDYIFLKYRIKINNQSRQWYLFQFYEYMKSLTKYIRHLIK